ncbi:hypothetical protein [Pseudomonas phage vB_Pa-PAC5]
MARGLPFFATWYYTDVTFGCIVRGEGPQE